jgi:hypothetical protein
MEQVKVLSYEQSVLHRERALLSCLNMGLNSNEFHLVIVNQNA